MGAATVSIKTLNIKVLFAKLNYGAKALSITTFRIMTLSTMALFAKFTIIDNKA
jgi:hypothetical protein